LLREEDQSTLFFGISEFINSPNIRVSASGIASRRTNNPDTISEACSAFIETSLRVWLSADLCHELAIMISPMAIS
jgi:hypothetical protein